MKQDRIYIFQELLVTQINNLILYPLVLTFATLFDDLVPAERPSLIVWMLAGLVYLAYYFCRKYVHQFILLVLSHAVGIGIIVLLSYVFSPSDSIVNRVFLIMAGVGFAIYSLYLRLVTEDFEDKIIIMPVAVGIVAVSLFLQHYQGNNAWDTYYKIALILVLAFYFLNYYLKEYLNFLIVNASSSGVLPEKEIFYSGLRMSFLYTLLGALILLATAQYSWLKNILSVLKNILYKIIRAIFSLFPDNTTSVYEPEKQEQMTGGGATLLEGGEASMFWKILEVVAILALLAAIVLGIIYGVRQFIAFVSKMMGKRGISHDKLIRSTDSLDVREKCEVQKKKGQSKHALDFWGFLDSKERIRKIYKKKAAAYKPNPLTNGSAQKKDDYSPERVAYYTAREMERQMQSNPFADIYEKARYSNEECTSQDVKRMKENCV